MTEWQRRKACLRDDNNLLYYFQIGVGPHLTVFFNNIGSLFYNITALEPTVCHGFISFHSFNSFN